MPNDDVTIESSLPIIRQNGFITNEPIINGHGTTVAINASATATAAQVLLGYITSTSAQATTITLPTGTNMGAALNAAKGTIFDFWVDNTAGASTLTIATNTSATVSEMGLINTGSFGLLTVSPSTSGIARFTMVFSNPSAYLFTRTA